jgi:predicted esterase
MPADADYLEAFPDAPSSHRDTELRVMFIHGGGSKDGDDRENEPFARYLRARFERFSMRAVRHTSDFELVVRTHAEEAARFQPDVIVGQSQGGPTMLELMHRGLWHGPSVLCCPASVPTVDDHLQRLPDDVPLLIATGDADEQVPLQRVQALHSANQARLQQGLGLVVVADAHALCSLLHDGKPAAHLEGSAGVEPACGTLFDLVQAVWAMRERVASKRGYVHAERLPTVSTQVQHASSMLDLPPGCSWKQTVLDEMLAHVQARVAELRLALEANASVAGDRTHGVL